MDSETLKALQGAIKKWQRIVAGTGEDRGVVNCPLCQMFVVPHVDLNGHPIDDLVCVGCPVMKKTGKRYCEGSPYPEYRLVDKNTENAQKELDFLRSLLPNDQKA